MEEREFGKNMKKTMKGLIDKEILFEEIGLSYDELKKQIPTGYGIGTFLLLKRRYEQEQRLKNKFGNLTNEELEQKLQEKETELEYLRVYLRILIYSKYKVDFEKMKENVPLDELPSLWEKIVEAKNNSMQIHNRKHPLHGMIMDKNKIGNKEDEEFRKVRIQEAIKSEKINIQYINKILEKREKEKIVAEESKDSQERNQTTELTNLMDRSNELDRQIQEAEALEKSLGEQQKGPTPGQGDK